MLKQRAFKATLWSGGEIFLRQGLQFVISVALARLLTPAEFGLVALLALFTGVATVMVDGGFSAALIQRQDVSHADESTVFWFNLGIGAAAALILLMAAPAIAHFYGQPILVPLMAVMSANVFLGSLGAIHSTLLTKRLDFRTQLKVGVVASVLSGVVAITMAWKGYGVWALAAQIVVMTTVTTALLWLANRWRPTWTFSRGSVNKLFGFGGYYLASNLLEIIYTRLYTLLIGRWYGARELGFYNNADNTKQMPGGFLTGVLSRVAFPMFSTAAHDKVKLRRGMQLAARGTMLLNVPMMLGMAALAEPLVRTLFGEQWLPAVPILRVLCVAGLFWPLHVLNLNVLMAQGHSRLMFRLELAKKFLGVAVLGTGAFFGVMGIAWATTVFSAGGLAINTYYSGRFLDYGLMAQLRDFLPIVFIALPMAAVVYALSMVLRMPPVIELALLIVLGGTIFFTIAWLTRATALHDVMALFKRIEPTDHGDAA